MNTPQDERIMSLAAALRYPFRGRGWHRRILILALAQFIPVVGQLVLLGYGQEIVRSVYAGETALPAIHWMRALRDGGLFCLAGLLYLTPIVPLLSKLFVADVVLGFLGITLPPDSAATLVIRGLVNAALALFGGLIIIGLHVGGVRHALGDRTGLIVATSNARLLVKHRALSGRLILNVLLIGLAAVITVGLGAVLLILPGLYLLVSYSLALWYLFACYGLTVRIHEPNTVPEGSLGHGWLHRLLRR